MAVPIESQRKVHFWNCSVPSGDPDRRDPRQRQTRAAMAGRIDLESARSMRMPDAMRNAGVPKYSGPSGTSCSSSRRKNEEW
jgi:hypothetical protein